jgi:hypothetical protein
MMQPTTNATMSLTANPDIVASYEPAPERSRNELRLTTHGAIVHPLSDKRCEAL